MSEWIEVCDKSPALGDYVLCYVNDIVSGWVELLKYDNGAWLDAVNGEEFECIVTHWMPMPEPPKN
jgi:hypothetical protein